MTDKKYTIKDDGKGNYTVIDHNEPEHKQEYDTATLIREAESLIEYNKRQKEKETAIPKQEQKPQQKQVTVKQFQETIDDAKIMASINKPKQIFLSENIFDY
jgi:hypothetical protein